MVSISYCFAYQASLGAPENGIMTAELLERLFMEQHIEAAGLKRSIDPKENDASPPPKVHSCLDLFSLRFNGCVSYWTMHYLF